MNLVIGKGRKPVWESPEDANLGSSIEAYNETGDIISVSLGECMLTSSDVDHAFNQNGAQGTFESSPSGELVYSPAFFWDG